MKTILIKATVPDDMNIPLRNVIFSDENTFFRAEKNIEIIEPPSDTEKDDMAIEYVNENCKSQSGDLTYETELFCAGVDSILNRLGL